MRSICCEHCGMPKRPRGPVQECWVVGEQHFLHLGCRAGWEAAPAMQLPSGSKVFGITPGHRCEHCGSGRDVYLIQLPGGSSGQAQGMRGAVLEEKEKGSPRQLCTALVEE